VLRRPEVAAAIVGATGPEQVRANANASGIELTPDTLAACLSHRAAPQRLDSATGQLAQGLVCEAWT
jgi:aryl-alcohol dehydrogenase-like predicted oxidoreductase